MTSKGGNARLGASQTIVARAISLVATFLLAALAARYLGPDQAGAFFVVYALSAFFATIGRFGADNLALRLLGGDTRNARSDIGRLLGLVFIVGGAASALSAVVIIFFIAGAVEDWVVLLAATGVYAQSLAVTAGTVLRGMGHLASGVFAELGSLPMIATLGLVAAGVLEGGQPRLQYALIVLTTAGWCTAAWSLPLVLRTVRHQLNDNTEVETTFAQFARTHVRRLSSMMGTSALAYAVAWAPVFVLTLTATMEQVSYYSIALRVANIVALLPTIQISYLAPEFARRFFNGDIDRLSALAGREAFRVAALTALPLVVLFIFAEPIMNILFGRDFAPATPVMLILSVGVFIVMLFGQVNQLMLLCGLEVVALILTFFGIAIWATVGMLIGATIGAIGVACLGSAVGVLYAAVAAWQLWRRAGLKSYARLAG